MLTVEFATAVVLVVAAVPELFEEVVGERDGATVVRGVVVAVVAAVPEVVGTPAKDGKPRYVLDIRPKTNEVVVGPEAALEITQLAGSRYSWWSGNARFLKLSGKL